MTEEKNNTLFAKVTGEIVENISEKYKNSLRMELSFTNIFTMLTETIEVKLTETQKVDTTEYRADKIEKAFDHLSEMTGQELKVPKSITADSIKKAIKPIVGQSIEVFIGENTIEDKEGNLSHSTRYYSLFEGGNVEYLRANSKPDDLIAAKPEIKDTKKAFVGRIEGFTFENNDKYFTNDKPHEAQMVEETKTRRGLAEHLYGILKADPSNKAKEKAANLTRYMKENTIDGVFRGTTSGILQSVGVFSDKSHDAKEMDEITVMKLVNLMSNESARGRAYTASVRLLFTVNGVPKKEDGSDSIFQTHRLKASNFPKRGEMLVTTFNPHDTNFSEFAGFVQPLYQMGALNDEDLAELRTMTKWFDIINKIHSVITREEVYAKLALGIVADKKTFNFLGFQKPQPHEVVEGEVTVQTASEQHAEVQEESVVTETKEAIVPEEEVVAEVKTEKQDAPQSTNPFENVQTATVEDDDLPF